MSESRENFLQLLELWQNRLAVLVWSNGISLEDKVSIIFFVNWDILSMDPNGHGA